MQWPLKRWGVNFDEFLAKNLRILKAKTIAKLEFRFENLQIYAKKREFLRISAKNSPILPHEAWILAAQSPIL